MAHVSWVSVVASCKARSSHGPQVETYSGKKIETLPRTAQDVLLSASMPLITQRA